MLKLCNELGIGVNELLSSERIERKLKSILAFFKIASIILIVGAVASFITHLVMNYLNVENYNGRLFDILLPVFMVLAFVFSAISFYYRF